MERYIAEARRIEVQVFGFGDGHAVHLHERDCSIQRRFQKIIEESPAPLISDRTREAMCRAAVALCKQERFWSNCKWLSPPRSRSRYGHSRM